MDGTILRGGNTVGHWFYVMTEYHPDWVGFESKVGTMADDECAHGRTPAERIANPLVCTCGGSPQQSAD